MAKKKGRKVSSKKGRKVSSSKKGRKVSSSKKGHKVSSSQQKKTSPQERDTPTGKSRLSTISPKKSLDVTSPVKRRSPDLTDKLIDYMLVTEKEKYRRGMFNTALGLGTAAAGLYLGNDWIMGAGSGVVASQVSGLLLG